MGVNILAHPEPLDAASHLHSLGSVEYHDTELCPSGFPGGVVPEFLFGGKENGLWSARRASADLSIFPARQTGNLIIKAIQMLACRLASPCRKEPSSSSSHPVRYNLSGITCQV